ncbi:MAG: hypothetical protein KA731_00510 [Candidatus Moranbacteria bacterium]|nr:hypothetical protein [Candidatus Moranbacteria bacterium]MBP6033900.1 hypothetical protein [Candidatus Moranbacteria bacterium]MBP7695641.1 hypothetical protein [Candidatus Moranbacteria bacterium]
MRKLEKHEYDSVKGIGGLLKHYPHFHAVIEERRLAAERGEELHEFVVLRHFVLDHFGQVGRISPYPDGSMDHKGLCEPKAEFFADLHGKCQYVSVTLAPVYLPPLNIQCAGCGQYYGTEDCHDVMVWNEHEIHLPLDEFVGRQFWEVKHAFSTCHTAHHFFSPQAMIRNDRFIDLAQEPYFDSKSRINQRGWVGVEQGLGDWYVVQPGDETCYHRTQYFHQACFEPWMTEKTRREFEAVLLATGFDASSAMTVMPNGYGSFAYRGPWFRVELPEGSLRIGWRKRVIEIVLNDWPIDCASLLADESVTVGQQLVHAWDYDKAVQYLSRMRQAMYDKVSV